MRRFPSSTASFRITTATACDGPGQEAYSMEFRPARADELPRLCEMLESAKERLRLLGLTQWQSGIPNGEMLAADIAADAPSFLRSRESFSRPPPSASGRTKATGRLTAHGRTTNHTPRLIVFSPRRTLCARAAARFCCKKRKRSACGAACATCGSTHTGETSPCRPSSAGAASPCAG